MRKYILKVIVICTISLFPFFNATAQTDSFAPMEDQFVAIKSDTTKDEFAPIETISATSKTEICDGKCSSTDLERKGYMWSIGVLLFTILAGILVRFKQTRNFRTAFLVASIVILGFYRGACPCPIQSLQNTVFIFMGLDIKWQTLIYFVGLIPISYFFGKVFCGWICHLGALQEFIFMSSKFKLFQSEKAQKVMRYIRIVALIALIVQIVITQTNLFKKIDPFAIIYNFHSTYIVGWILVAILIVSSIFMYRPFCKTLCPIGLILGWISKIPGASVLGANHKCSSCISCNNSCAINAITRDSSFSVIDNQECIRCGDCLDGCKNSSLSFHFKSKKYESKNNFKKSIIDSE